MLLCIFFVTSQSGNTLIHNYACPKMSVTYTNSSQVSVTSKYRIPVISLISDVGIDGHVQPSEESKSKKCLDVSASNILKKTSVQSKSFDPVTNHYYKEMMKQAPNTKCSCVGENIVMKKRGATVKCVTVIVMDSLGELIG